MLSDTLIINLIASGVATWFCYHLAFKAGVKAGVRAGVAITCGVKANSARAPECTAALPSLSRSPARVCALSHEHTALHEAWRAGVLDGMKAIGLTDSPEEFKRLIEAKEQARCDSGNWQHDKAP